MRPAALTTLLALCACTDPVDKAAKQRIFSAEDPPQAVAAASQRLPPEDAASNPEVARRILRMSAAETAERLGAHRFAATVTWEWTRLGKNLRSRETRSLVSAAGGITGDFQASLEIDPDQGLEVMRVKSQVYARSRFGKFRERKRDRGMAERSREDVFGALRDFDDLFLGRLKLNDKGTTLIEGRTVWRYEVTLGPPLPDSGKRLPPLTFPKGKADETTGRRLAFFEARAPKALQGEVFVDAATSVVLKARLDGRLFVSVDAGDAETRLVVDASLSEIGKDPKLAVPSDALPDQDKPQGIAAALERFGVVKAPDAGVAGPGTPEPADDPAAE